MKYQSIKHLTKSFMIGALSVAFISACSDPKDTSSKSTPISSKSSGIYLDNIDHSIRPQDDFYRYVNGNWLDKTEIPEDKSTYGAFTALREKSRSDVKAIIEETSKLKNVEPGSDAQKVGDLYRSFMNTEKLNQLGKSPLVAEFKKIDALATLDDVAGYFAESQMIGSDAPFGFWVNNDSKNPTEYITFFTQSGLGLPDKKYYFKQDKKSEHLRQDYVAHIEKMLSLAGIANSAQKADQIMSFETQVADLHWDRKDRRDRNKTYNKLTLEQLSSMMPNFNWKLYFNRAGIGNQTKTIIREKSYFAAFSNLFAKTSLDTWQTYFKWTLINSASGILSGDFEQAHFDFYSTKLHGTP
ncbi:MAG: M13 family metallopeptidase N-terminal domain-containing protein [Enterobacterales bacterium]|nr:M13 family metallopeptidase N-terminal domain-containing protein [Enterobacterales bacterium]